MEAIVNYNHTEQAGNKGDVWKHVILLSVLEKMLPYLSRSSSVHYFETHCGRCSYILLPDGEWRDGIGTCSSVGKDLADHPYFCIQGDPTEVGPIYHGSWFLAAAYLRRKRRSFRFTLCDISNEIETSVIKYKTQIQEEIDFHCTDGFTALKKEVRRQDLIFIDPPYFPPDSPNDWQSCADISADRALSPIPFVIWYPLFDEENPQRLIDYAGSPGYEVQWKTQSGKKKMRGAGMVMGNCDSLFGKDDFTVLKRVAEHLGGRFHVRGSHG